MTIESTQRMRLWSLLCGIAIAATLAGCSGSSGGKAQGSSTTTPPTSAGTGTVPRSTTPATVPTRVRAVPASIDPTGRTDVTRRLQLFLAGVPNGTVVELPRGARYQVDGTLFLRGRRNVTIDGNGATVFAATRGAPDRSQWHVTDSAHISFRDLTVKGANAVGGLSEGAYVRNLETQHGFHLEGVAGVDLDHVTVTNVYGDCVYIGRDRKQVPSRDVWVHDSTCARNGRQGIAVTAATGVIIEHNTFRDTRRSTIDLEPTGHRWLVSNVFILNNAVGKGRLLFVASHGSGPVNGVVIAGNVLRGHSLTIDAASPGRRRRSDWIVMNNSSDTPVHSRPLRFRGIDGLVLQGNHQVVSGSHAAAVVTAVCGARISGNEFGGAAILQRGSRCNAPLAIPRAPYFAGRNVRIPTPGTAVPPPNGSTTPGSSRGPITAPAPRRAGGHGVNPLVWLVPIVVASLLIAGIVRARRRAKPRPSR